MLKYVYTLGYLFVIYVHLLFVVGCSNLVVLCDDDNYSDSDSSELNARYFSSRGVLSDLVIHGLLFGNTLIVLIDTSVSVKKNLWMVLLHQWPPQGIFPPGSKYEPRFGRVFTGTPHLDTVAFP